MLSHAQVIILSIVVVFAIRGYVSWHMRRVHSHRPPITTDSVETSEFGRGTLVASRCVVAAIIGMFGLSFWNDRTLIDVPRSAEAAGVRFLVVSSLMGLSWYLLGVLMRSSGRNLSYDREGLWRTRDGKAQGLVRWGDICSVKERQTALSLFDRDGGLLLEVEHERDGYFRIRNQVMEQMSFQPPNLPLDVSLPSAHVSGSVRLALTCAALLCFGIGVLSIAGPQSHVLVPLFLCGAVMCGLLAWPRTKVILGVDGITIRGKTYPYLNIRSIEASFLSPYYVHTPRLMLDVGENKPVVILTNGLVIDSLTLQRTLLWVMARVKRED